MKGAAVLSHACSPTVSTNGDKNADSFCISISCLSRSTGTFIAAGVKNNVSLCNKNPNPGVQRTSNKEFSNNRSYFARPFPFESSGIPGKAGTLQTSTSVQMVEFASAATCYFGFFPLSLSTTFPRYYPPFSPLPPRTGGPVTGS